MLCRMTSVKSRQTFSIKGRAISILDFVRCGLLQPPTSAVVDEAAVSSNSVFTGRIRSTGCSLLAPLCGVQEAARESGLTASVPALPFIFCSLGE